MSRENSYPGAACDVPSRLYSYSFAQPVWPRRYSRQPEILGYLEDQVDRYDLRDRLRFGAGVGMATWDEEGARWTLALSDGTTVTATVVVSAVGQLTRPVLPDIDGRAGLSGVAVAYKSGCHSWYANASGRNINNWPTFTFLYRRKLRHLDLLDFDIAPAAGERAVPA
ncbi:MAG: hypothetical protein M3256_07810 [Actinomycetota bacterium]|nr:hypothetical protein [Actinomycetota bacterium]